MSRNLRVFLGVAFWIPFSFFIWIVFKGYANSRLVQSSEICWQNGVDMPNSAATQAHIANFVGCLKEKNNPVVWWYLEPERLYQIAEPHTPCQWVGTWQAKRDNIAFGMELKANGRFVVEMLSQEEAQLQHERSFTGVWSSPQLNRILWFSDAHLWPIDDNSVEWQNQNQLVINELNGSKTYYQRVSSRLPNCPAYP